MVNPLHHTIGLWVIGCGGDVLYPLLLKPVSPRARGELGLPVVGDAGRQAKVGHPHDDEGLQHRVHINAVKIPRRVL